MNAVHLHLIVNHVPIAAMWLAVPVLVLALVRLPNRDAWMSATLLTTIAAVFATFTLLTGEPAEEALEGRPDIDMVRLEAHEETGELGAYIGIAAGVISLVAWGLARRAKVPAARAAARAAICVTMAASIVSGSVLAWAGYTGGLIRHPEIHEDVPTRSSSATTPGK